MTGPRVGSLCTGYGGLDQAVHNVLGGTTAWVSDIDPGASQILAHRMPGIPNIGDLTTTDWAAVEPVDIVLGGYPCQPFSLVGDMKGTADARHLWPFIAGALRVLRPKLAIFENVANHLRLGFDTVLTDLADLRLDAEWHVARASASGLAHERRRLIFLAWPADAAGPRLPGSWLRGRTAERGADVANPADLGHERPGGARRGWAGSADSDLASASVRWGRYESAIRRAELVLGRRAPRPTDDRNRLSPAFVEWLMGLEAGWVTDVPGLTRTQQLHALGNGVVPQQAEAAIRFLLDRASRTAATA